MTAERTPIFALFLLLATTLLGLALAACGPAHGGKADRIDGVVLGDVDGAEQPLGEVSVSIRPEGVEGDLVGVAVTNYAGRFTIDTLSSVEKREETGLLRDTTYRATIMTPEYWVFDEAFEYDRGTETFDFLLVRKDADLNNASVPESTGDAPLGSRGSVRKGTQ